MKKTITILLLTILLASCSDKEIKEADKRLSDCVGGKLIIGKDTLEVVDYSLFKWELILEDGRSINVEYFEKKKLTTPIGIDR